MGGWSRFGEFRRDLAWLSPSHRFALLAVAVLVAFAASVSSSLPILREMELAVFDLITTTNADLAATDKRVVLVVYTDETLRNTGSISPVDRTILAEALVQIDTMEPKAVGIDILLDTPQPDDPALQAALRHMRVPTFLAFADNRTTPSLITRDQERTLRAFFISLIANPKVAQASAIIETGGDGVVRNWPRTFGGLPPRPTLAVALAEATGSHDARFIDYRGPVRFRRSTASEQPLFEKIPIDLLADDSTAPILAEAIRGRYVLIGGDIADFDQFDTPLSRTSDETGRGSRMIGVEVHATMLTQLLDGAIVEALSPVAKVVLAMASLLVGMAIATFSRRRRVQLPLLIALAAVIVGGSVRLALALGTPTNIALAGWLLAALAGVLIVRSVRKAAQWEQGATAMLALQRYLPPDIAKAIVTQPDKLGLDGELRQVFVMFTDLEGFTKMCQKVEPQVVAAFLNDYLERICQVILDHGGTIDKFVGDAVVAFWGAPLATPEDGRHAVEAAVAIERETATLIGNELAPGATVGRTRIGIHYGTAIVGNFGGNGRLQYTALGDTMNVGARLEGANKELDTSILASGELVAQVPELAFRRMGRVTVRGRNAPLDIYEPALSRDPGEVDRLNGFYDAVLRGDTSALEAMSAWAQDHPDDVAMASLVRRLRSDEATAPTSV